MQYLSPFPGFRKSRILARRVEELRHAFKQQRSAAGLLRAAERVRTARLHLLKALLHAAAPCTSEDTNAAPRLANLESEFEFWIRRSPESIIDEFAK